MPDENTSQNATTTTATEPTLHDVVADAIKNAGGKIDDTPPAAVVPPAEAAPASDGEPQDGTEPQGDEPDPLAEPEGDQKPEGEGEIEAKGKETPADEAKPKKPSDDVGELPADAPAKTRERFEKLKRLHDEAESKREAAEQRAEAWQRTVESTGATPEQFGTLLSYLKDVNSGERSKLERAHAALLGELTNLSKALGMEAPGFDPLADHADLREQIEAGDLTRSAALELAKARAARKIDEVRAARASEPTSEQKYAAEAQAAVDELKKWGDGRRAENPTLYAARQKRLEEYVAKLIKEKVPPQKWLDKIDAYYEGLPLIAQKPASTPAGPVPATRSPITGSSAGGGGGGLKPEPKSTAEAVSLALAELNARRA